MNVVPITSAPKSVLSTQLKESVEAYDLASFVYAIDQRLGRASMALPFDRLSLDAREQLVTRAAIAIRLGDPVKAIAVGEHAALGIVRDVTDRIKRQELRSSDPEVAIELRDWRRLARVAVLNALEYLGGVPRNNVTALQSNPASSRSRS